MNPSSRRHGCVIRSCVGSAPSVGCPATVSGPGCRASSRNRCTGREPAVRGHRGSLTDTDSKGVRRCLLRDRDREHGGGRPAAVIKIGHLLFLVLVEDLIAGRGRTFQARPGGASGEVSAGQGGAASTATQGRGPTRPVNAGNCSRHVHLNRTGHRWSRSGCFVPCVGCASSPVWHRALEVMETGERH